MTYLLTPNGGTAQMLALYRDTGLVEYQTLAKISTGGVTKSWTTRINPLACRLTKGKVNEADEFGKMTTREAWMLHCYASAMNKTIKESDRITISSQVFQVKGIYNPSNLDHHLEIELLLLTE